MRSDFQQKRLERAILDQPGNPQLHFELGRYWKDEGDYPAAVRSLEKATMLDKFFALAHYELGIVYTLMRQYDTAIKEWQRMQDVDGDLDLAFVRQSKIDRILSEWEHYRESFSGAAAVCCFNMGFVYLVLGMLNQSVDELRMALQMKTGLPLAHFFLGLGHYLREEYDLAAVEMNAELIIRPGWANALYWQGSALLEANKTAQGVRVLGECLRLKPDYIKANFRLGQAYARSGNYEQATNYLMQVVRRAPNFAASYFELGQILEKQYQMEEAVSPYRKAVELDPKNKTALVHLGLVYKTLGRASEALEVLNRAAELDATDADIHYYLGMLNDQMGYYDEAIRSYGSALNVTQSHSFAQYGLGLAYKKKGKLAEAAREFQRAVDLNPRDIQARNALGETYFQMGNLAACVDEFDRVLEQNPRDLRALYFHGAALFRMGRTDDAIQTYHKIVSSNPNSPYAHFSMGAIYVRSGEFDQARESFSQATSLDPTSETDLNLLATLQLMGAIGMEHAETGKKLREHLLRMTTIWERTIQTMVSAVDARDEYTRDHSYHVSTVAHWFGEYLSLDAHTLEAIRIGGLLHDIGKIGIPDFILRKPGKLSEWEFEVMRDHPRIGWEIIQHLDLPWDVRPMVEYHHERWDGTGYPHGKKGLEIPLTAQIMTLADFWDALRSQRSYKKAFSAAVTLEEMQKLKSKHFEPSLVDRFEGYVDWAATLKGEQWKKLYPAE